MGEAAAPKPDAAPVLLALRKLGLFDGDKSGTAAVGGIARCEERGQSEGTNTTANI